MSEKSIIECPACSQELRIPVMDSSIVVSCPCGRKFDCIRGSILTSEQPCTSQVAGGFAESLKNKCLSDLPDEWTIHRLKDTLCELWYPADWRIDASDKKAEILLRPDFSSSICEQERHFVMTPAFKFFVFLLPNLMSIKDYLDATRQNNEKSFDGFRMLSEEVVELQGYPTGCRRYCFKRAGKTWEAICVIRFVGKSLCFFDASGIVEHMTEHREVLEEVLANVRIFQTQQAFESAGREGLVDPSWDVLPENPHLGILFEIDKSPDSNYGDFFWKQFAQCADASVVEGCRLSVGDVLPKCKYYCMKLEVPDASVGRYLREQFGELCLAKGIAPLRNRFVSGRPLDRLNLCLEGFIKPATDESLSLRDGTEGKSLLFEGTIFPLFQEEEAFFEQSKKTNQTAILIAFSQYWDVLANGNRIKAIDTSGRLLCAACLRQMPFSFSMMLNGDTGASWLVSGEGLPENLFEAAEKKQCPWCQSTEGLLVYDSAPIETIVDDDMESLRELWAERCKLWWAKNNRSECVCDRCLKPLTRRDGYLNSEITCEACACKSANPEKLEELQNNIHYFGTGELRRARNFKAGLWNFEGPKIIKDE